MTQTKWERGQFVAWDGEGVTRRGRHEYVLLANSEGAYDHSPRGITTADALGLLARGIAAAPHAIHVGFAISYDANMMFRDLPRLNLARLWTLERTEWKGFRIDWRPRKYLRVFQDVHGERIGGTVWDVWPFFQSSFVGALEKYNVGTPTEWKELRAMKARRSSFTARDVKAILSYNRDELRLLVALMETLHASLRAANLSIKRWDGPGAIAAALLARNDYKTRVYMNGTRPPNEPLLDAFQYAYYGGRIEALRYGHMQGPVHHYDVNSAYPAAMRSLPCRGKRCGSWERYDGLRMGALDDFSVHHVRWSFAPRVAYPFPWRSSKGGVFFPPAGEGWVWSPELREAYHIMGEGDRIERVESWVWESTCRHKSGLCDWMDATYRERLAAKARGDGAEHALKLGINSCYGKLAQRVGAQWDERESTWRLPPYHDLAGAGWITSTVRAQLYRAAMQRPRDIIMLATDGIYSTRALKLPVSADADKTLGEWSYAKHTGCTVVQSGVYFLDDGDEVSLYSRGFDADSVDRAAILRAWHRGAASVTATQSRFIGLGRALAGDESFKLWRTWASDPRELALHPWLTKRVPILSPGRSRPSDPSVALQPTRAFDTRRYWHDPLSGHGMMTTPSAVPWRDMDDGYVEGMDRAGREEDESEDARL